MAYIVHHRLLHVISVSYCQVFLNSYTFVFEKINIEYALHQKWQKGMRFGVYNIHAARTIPPLTCVLSTSHMKTAFLHSISISVHKYDAVQKALFMGKKVHTVK